MTDAVAYQVKSTNGYHVFQVSGDNQSGNVTQTHDPKFKYLELTRHLK